MPSENRSEKKKLFGGVAVLMPAAIFTKVVGLFYKIPLIAIVGVTGMAYFLAAYHLYSVVFVLSATGLPTALSLAVARAVAAGQHRTARRVFGVALAVFLSIGLCGTAALLCFAPMLAQRLAMADAAAAIAAIAPALLLSGFIGAAKGYFQGLGHMLPTAVSEVLEALGKLGFGLCFALLAKGRGLPDHTVAAFAIFGITAGLALAAVVLGVWLLIYRVRHRPCAMGERLPRRRRVLAELLKVALPITVSASVMSVVTLLDTALISARLQAAGFAPAVAHAMYSSYGNLAVPLYNLVPSLLTPVTLSLMPLLGASLSKGEAEAGKGALSSAFRFTALFSIPAALGLAVFAEPILGLIYRGQGEAVALAAPLLALLALSVLPVALLTLFGAALQATGHTVIPVLAMGAGALVKLTVEAILLGLPTVHIYGAPISTLCCNLTVLLIEGAALSRVLPFGLFAGRDLFRPLAAAVLGVGAGAGFYFALLRAGQGGAPATVSALVLTVALYALLALRLGAVAREDIGALPRGERLCTALQKLKLLK